MKLCRKKLHEYDSSMSSCCVECHKISAKKWYEAHRNTHKKKTNSANASARWRVKHPAKYMAAKLFNKYGITVEQYNNMRREQSDVCAICNGPEVKVGKNGGVVGLSVDHNHATGKVRGLLCHACNVMLGLSKEKPEVLKKAAKYLDLYDSPG